MTCFKLPDTLGMGKRLSEIRLRFGRVRVNSVAREEYSIVNAELFTNSLTNLAEVSKPLNP